MGCEAAPETFPGGSATPGARTAAIGSRSVRRSGHDLGEDRARRMRADQDHHVAGRQPRYRGQYQRMPLVVLDFAHVKTAVDIQQRRVGVRGPLVPVAPLAGRSAAAQVGSLPTGHDPSGEYGTEEHEHGGDDLSDSDMLRRQPVAGEDGRANQEKEENRCDRDGEQAGYAECEDVVGD